MEHSALSRVGDLEPAEPSGEPTAGRHTHDLDDAAQPSPDAESAFRRAAKAGLAYLYPGALLLGVLILSLGRWSGTSAGAMRLGQQGSHDSSLVIGTPRPIRSDEWAVSTPLAVANSRNEFPRFAREGVGTHDLSVILDVPNRHWSTLFKPFNLPFFLFDVERAVAARWWLLAWFLLVPSYGLFRVMTGRNGLSILFSLSLYLSPFFHWWYEPLTLATAGFAMAALAAFLAGLNSRSSFRRWAWVAVSTYLSLIHI